MSKKFKIPEAVSWDRSGDEDYDAACQAAYKHSKHLRKSEGHLIIMYDLAIVLKNSLNKGDDERCETGVTVIGEIIKRLDKMRARLEEHGNRHSNLFVAYFDLKAEGGAS